MTDWIDLPEYDERAIAAFMSRVADLPVPSSEPGVADSSLWWKAQLLNKWEAERRAQRPLDIMLRIEIAGGLIAAGVLVYLSLAG